MRAEISVKHQDRMATEIHDYGGISEMLQRRRFEATGVTRGATEWDDCAAGTHPRKGPRGGGTLKERFFGHPSPSRSSGLLQKAAFPPKEREIPLSVQPGGN